MILKFRNFLQNLTNKSTKSQWWASIEAKLFGPGTIKLRQINETFTCLKTLLSSQLKLNLNQRNFKPKSTPNRMNQPKKLYEE